MKLGIIIKLSLLLFISNCFSMDNEAILDSLFGKIESYYEDDIPNKYKRFYSDISNNLNTSKYKLKGVLEKNNINITKTDTLFCMQAEYPNNNNILVVLWNSGFKYSFYYNFESKNIINFKKEIPKSYQSICGLVELWDQSILDRSYYRSTIAGGAYFIASRIINKDNRLKISNTSFVQFETDINAVFHKEKKENGYETIITWEKDQ